jgi:hypothetical protein
MRESVVRRLLEHDDDRACSRTRTDGVAALVRSTLPLPGTREVLAPQFPG